MLAVLKSHKGITLLELLVASVIALVCTGAALEVYVSQQKGWLAQENISDMQQNGRAAIDEIVFHIRQAGYNLPADIEAIIAANSDPDTITLTALREPVCEAVLLNPMASPSSELDCDPSGVGCFEIDTWAYIFDPGTKSGEFFYISQVQAASGKINHGLTLSKAYPANSEISMVEMISFYIDNSTDPEHPKLIIERIDGVPQIYADNIEDLQFTYTLGYGAVVESLVTSKNVREISVMLVAKTERHDFITGEDYVRDTFSTSVYVRNIAF